MLREQSHLIVQTHKLLDIFLTVIAFILAYFIKKDFLPEPFRGLITAPSYYIVLLLHTPLRIGFFRRINHFLRAI